MTLKALKNHILFKFVDPVNSKGEFVRAKTSFGLEFLPTADDSSKTPRWAEVLAVGPEVEKVLAGDFILLPALRWTIGTKHEGERFWRTDETEVAVVKRDDTKFAVLNSFVVFKRHAHKANKSTIVVIHDIENNTPFGVVSKVGPDVEHSLLGAKIYFNGDNFFNTTTPEDKVAPFQFSFIKEGDILVYEPLEHTVVAE